MSETEKLIELIGGTRYGIENRSTVGANFQRGFIEKIANHLLANGIRLETKQATSDKSKRLIDVSAVDFAFPLTDDMAGMLKQIGIEMAKTRVMEAPTVDAAEVVRGMWIPVTERLPDDDIPSSAYLCWWSGHCQICKYWRSRKAFEFNGRVVHVTHWMPLPEPPKEENHG